MLKSLFWTLVVSGCAAPLAGEPLATTYLSSPQGHQPANTIHVTGQGSVQATPDTARLRIGVTHEADTAREAQAQVARVASALLNAWKGLGIPDKQIQTQALSIYPVFSDPKPGGSPTITGYRANELFRLELKDLSLIGPAIDHAVQAGANDWQGVEFTLKDDKTARQTALEKAMQNAREQAEAATGAEQLALGKITRITVGQGMMPPPVPMMEMRQAMGAATPVATGQVDITATVEVEYSL